MKKIFTLFAAMLLICCVSAQQFGLNPNFKPTTENLTTDSFKDDRQVEITWLTSTGEATSFGYTEATTVMPLMEFDLHDVRYFENEMGKIASVEKIMFFINSEGISSISSLRVVIRQGITLQTSTEVLTQTVPNVVAGWNTIELTTPYVVNSEQSLFIGYEVVTSGSGFPASVAAGTNTKQAWYKNRSGYLSLLDLGYDYVFMIKALATISDLEDIEISLRSVSTPSYALLNDMVTIKGRVRNIGNNTITSFSASYEIGGATETEDFTGLNIATGGYYEFTFTDQYQVAEAIIHTMNVEVSNPNGEVDGGVDNISSVSLPVFSENVQRKVLHEGFSSSTCGPCKDGNAALKQILNSADAAKYVNVKYQMSWPSPGDPYYTAEGESKRVFYNVTSVPDLYINGSNKKVYYYSLAQLNELATIPAKIKLDNTVTLSKETKTISVDLTITPIMGAENSNLRLFVAIVEKITAKNKKTNGETQFFDVMKKFMTSTSGETIGTLSLGTPIQRSFTYTFNGDYRLPSNASSPINHATEHSVEDRKSV
ncbi:MAG: Omp28-related outer membrane protein, partial [Bacteroidales bacterium]|nr:Omp28-related outer membrane protein [Bacteroidales bacterium]